MKEFDEFIKDWQESLKQKLPPGYLEYPIPPHETYQLEAKRPKKVLDVDWVRPEERKALFWLSKSIHYDAMSLMTLLGGIRRGRVHYCVHFQSKKNGKLRVIHEPSPELKKFQRLLARHVISELDISANVYGFSRGGVVDAIKPHIKAKSWMMLDIKNAFPSIVRRYVDRYLKFGGVKQPYETKFIEDKDGYSRLSREKVYGPFSITVARAICDLCMFTTVLPQGAPSSPRIFDYMFHRMDNLFNEIAKRNKAKYTRYADNLFFSTRKKRFDKNLMWRILEEFDFVSEHDIEFRWHKLKVRHYTREAVRMLGLNIIDGQLHNTRSFKLNLRKHVHHIKWLKANGKNYDTELERLIGMMGFAVRKTLPKKLLKEINYIKRYY